MKKFISLILCTVTLLCCLTVYAETPDKQNIGKLSINGVFELSGQLPEGYSLKIRKMEQDEILAWIISENPEKPQMQLSIAYDEAYANVDRFNDLDEADFEKIEKTFTDEDPTVEISYGDTGYGTRLLIAKQVNDIFNYVDFFSIYKGYMIEFVLLPANMQNSEVLTDEQINMCIDFLTELDFIPATDEQNDISEETDNSVSDNI